MVGSRKCDAPPSPQKGNKQPTGKDFLTTIEVGRGKQQSLKSETSSEFTPESSPFAPERMFHLATMGIFRGKLPVSFRKSALPKTNSSHLKIALPKRKLIFQPQCFWCYEYMLVSGRVRARFLSFTSNSWEPVACQISRKKTQKKQDLGSWTCEPRKKKLLSMKYWLVNRDLFHGLY